MNEHRKIAILLTCFNRVGKTLKCLESIFSQNAMAELSVFLVDDGSTDGTADAVFSRFPQVNIIQGNGKLFWAGGMRLAWETALSRGPFDFYWLVNDDTVLYETALTHLLEAHRHALETYGKPGIYTGSTCDPETKAHSYGGQRLNAAGNYASVPVVPDGTFQKCDFCNANILLVPAAVAEVLGILSNQYTHAIADYDYSMRAVRAGYPVLVLPGYAGECVENRGAGNLAHLNLRQRIQHLYSPKGFSYREFLHFIGLFFPKTYLRTALTLWVRTLFPSLWNRFKGK